MVNDIVRLKCNAKQDVLREKLLKKKSNLEKNFTDQWGKALRDADLPLYVVSNPSSFNWAIRKLLFDTLLGFFVERITVNLRVDLFNKINKVWFPA